MFFGGTAALRPPPIWRSFEESLQQPLQPLTHARAICSSNTSSLWSSWYSSALSVQYASLVNASGASSHSQASASMASWRPWHVSLHHLLQHVVQVPLLQYMISYFLFSRELHSASGSPRKLSARASDDAAGEARARSATAATKRAIREEWSCRERSLCAGQTGRL